MCLKSLMKIGHNNAFPLLFFHCFKIRNISFALACMTGKFFRKLWHNWSCFQLIWGHLRLFSVIFKLIRGQSGIFWLLWLLLSLLKILFRLNYFFYLNLTWAMLMHSRGTLFSISVFFQRKSERGWGVFKRLLSAGTKTSANWKFRNYKSDVNEFCMTYAPP